MPLMSDDSLPSSSRTSALWSPPLRGPGSPACTPPPAPPCPGSRGRATSSSSSSNRPGSRYLSLYGSPYPTTPNLVAEAGHALVYDSFYAHVGLTANSLAALGLSIYPYMTWREYTQEYPDFPGDDPRQRAGPPRLPHGLPDLLLPRLRRPRRLPPEPRLRRGPRLARPLEGERHQLLGRRRQPSWSTGRWSGSTAIASAPSSASSGRSRATIPTTPRRGSRSSTSSRAGRFLPTTGTSGDYLNTLAEVDRQLGRLFAGLRERGLADDTLVVVTGDHGECFGAPHRTWGHGFRLYQEGINVPLMLWNPRLFEGGGRPPTIAGHVDVNPTVLDILGVPAPASWEGRSVFAPGRPPRAYFYAANDDYLLGVREGPFKYIYNVTRGREELYDLARDPDEQTNVAGVYPDDAASSGSVSPPGSTTRRGLWQSPGRRWVARPLPGRARDGAPPADGVPERRRGIGCDSCPMRPRRWSHGLALETEYPLRSAGCGGAPRGARAPRARRTTFDEALPAPPLPLIARLQRGLRSAAPPARASRGRPRDVSLPEAGARMRSSHEALKAAGHEIRERRGRGRRGRRPALAEARGERAVHAARRTDHHRPRPGPAGDPGAPPGRARRPPFPPSSSPSRTRRTGAPTCGSPGPSSPGERSTPRGTPPARASPTPTRRGGASRRGSRPSSRGGTSPSGSPPGRSPSAPRSSPGSTST